MERLLFANIGWMIHYQGHTKNDKIIGGGSYRNDDKHEAYNFQNLKGYCYGFVHPVAYGTINLNRIDKSIGKDHNKLDGVLVIWTAKNPESSGTYIVGWYKNATVYKTWQDINDSKRNNYSYNIKAKYQDCFLLPTDDRTFEIPRANKGSNKGFMGQSNVWYADMNIDVINFFRNDVKKYIYSVSDKKSFKRHSLRVNLEAKKKVEKNAIDAVTLMYKDKGYKVVSVENDNLGWDLEAVKNKIKLRIEVKGLSEGSISVHLTPNEYSKMKAKNNYGYRLCVVTNALTKPVITTFIFDGKMWVCEDDPEIYLSFSESIAAIAFVE